MYEEVIRDIRKRCRMAMNGVASTSMRQHGLNYKLNFGVSIQQVREIASRYQPDKGLAEELWKDGTRELKILATMLYPKPEFSEETAMRWIKEIPNQEIREQMGFNLFQHLSYTFKIGYECTLSEDKSIRASGYWFVGRHLMISNYKTDIDVFSVPHVWEDVVDEDVSLRNAAKLFLKNMGKVNPVIAKDILAEILPFKDSEDLLKKEVYHGLAFEYEYYYENYKY